MKLPTGSQAKSTNDQNSDQENQQNIVENIANKLLEPLKCPTPVDFNGRLSARSRMDTAQGTHSFFFGNNREDQLSSITPKSPFTNAFEFAFGRTGAPQSPFLNSKLTPGPESLGFRFSKPISSKKIEERPYYFKEEKIQKQAEQDNIYLSPEDEKIKKQKENSDNKLEIPQPSPRSKITKKEESSIDDQALVSSGSESSKTNSLKKKEKFRMRLQKLKLKKKEKQERDRKITERQDTSPNIFKKPFPSPRSSNLQKEKKPNFNLGANLLKVENTLNVPIQTQHQQQNSANLERSLVRIRYLLEQQRELYNEMNKIGVKPLIILPPVNSLDLKGLDDLGKSLNTSLVPDINLEVLKMKSLYESNFGQNGPLTGSIDQSRAALQFTPINSVFGITPAGKQGNVPSRLFSPNPAVFAVQQESSKEGSEFSFECQKLKKRSPDDKKRVLRPMRLEKMQTPNKEEISNDNNKVKTVKTLLSEIRNLQGPMLEQTPDGQFIDPKQKLKKPKKRIKCRCSTTKCLKLYCRCFKGGIYCDNCKCKDCHNTPDHVDEVVLAGIKKAMNITDNSNTTFEQRGNFINNLKNSTNNIFKGCTCKKTGCLLNYCECFKRGIGCSYLCECSNCQNDKAGN